METVAVLIQCFCLQLIKRQFVFREQTERLDCRAVNVAGCSVVHSCLQWMAAGVSVLVSSEFISESLASIQYILLHHPDNTTNSYNFYVAVKQTLRPIHIYLAFISNFEHSFKFSDDKGHVRDVFMILNFICFFINPLSSPKKLKKSLSLIAQQRR